MFGSVVCVAAAVWGGSWSKLSTYTLKVWYSRRLDVTSVCACASGSTSIVFKMAFTDDLLGSFDPTKTSSNEEKKPSTGDSFRDSLNLEDFEKVDADFLDQGSAFTSSNPVAGSLGSDPISGDMKEVIGSISDTVDSLVDGVKSSEVPFLTDKMSEEFLSSKENMNFDESSVVGISGGIDEPKDTKNILSDIQTGEQSPGEKESAGQGEPWTSGNAGFDGVGEISGSQPATTAGLIGDFSSGSFMESSGNTDMVQEPLVSSEKFTGTIESAKEPSLYDNYPQASTTSVQSNDPFTPQGFTDDIPSKISAVEEPAMLAKEIKDQQSVEPPKDTSPYGMQDSPPSSPSPQPQQPIPTIRDPTPPRVSSPSREPTPPPRESVTPPREPTPPPREPTPPPREPTPPPREPTPPPREPTPPPREPTPPPREPTPPPREPTPPPREPTPPPREPTPPPREPTPPLQKPVPSVQVIKSSEKSSSKTVSSGTGATKSYPPLDDETRRKFAVLNPSEYRMSTFDCK